MEETAVFCPFFDDFNGSGDLYHYTYILDYEAEIPSIIKTIADRIMERVRLNNVDTMLEADDLPVLCTIPTEHMMFLLGEFILRASQIMNKHITVIAEEFSVKNNHQPTRLIDRYTHNESVFTKDDYSLLIRLLKAKTMQFAVDIYLKSYIRAYDHHDESKAVAAIVKFINNNVFYQEDIDYARLFDTTHIPKLFMNQETLKIHLFTKDHPLIAECHVNIVKDLSNCFIDKTVPELYRDLMNLVNFWANAEPEIAIAVNTTDDGDYIKLLTDNCRNGTIEVIQHSTSQFIESCKRFYKEFEESHTYYGTKSSDPIIMQLIALHDLQFGLTDDDFDYPEHPPDDMDMLPKPLRPILYRIGKAMI